jgi:CheY-like chemotaxis protein
MNKKIMLVDDSRDFVTVIKAVLQRNGYEVCCAYYAAGVFNQLEEEKPDLILLDVMMPQTDGLEVLSRLKASTQTAAIPVILLTAKAQYSDLLFGYAHGAEAYITKPCTSTRLLAEINRILGKRDRDPLGRPIVTQVMSIGV